MAMAASSLHAFTCVWTNPVSGSWHTAANWSPNVVPGAGDGAVITNLGTYTVLVTNSVTVGALFIGGHGAPSLVVDNLATMALTNAIVAAGGTMVWSNSWITGTLTVQAGGQLFCAAPVNTYIYSLTLTNEGTVTWSSGSMNIGGTRIYNSGLWQITGNNTMGYGGGGQPVWINAGTLRKTAGSGTSDLGGFNFFNQPGALVDVLAGTLSFNGGTTNVVAGSFISTAPAMISLINGIWTDGGGTFSGTGTNMFNGGIFNFRTNVPPGLKFSSGDLYITGTSTFQQGGVITNLTLDGAALHGTNFVGAGALYFNGGNLLDQLTILPAGQLIVGGTAGKLIYGLTLVNQGTVVCGGSLNMGNTVVSNGGLWQLTGDFPLSYGGYALPLWTNSGTLRKTGTTTTFSQIDANFVNLPGALVEAQVGRIVFGSGTANQMGGTFNAIGIIEFNNGTWTDAGGVATGPGTNVLYGGTLNLRTNVPPSLRLAGGTVFITGTNTFQNSGAITNLTLDGATLAGTNSVSGTLLMNAGALTGQLTVSPGAQLTFATTTSKFLSAFTLLNRGTVTVNGTSVSAASTTINNSGLWQIAGNCGLNYGGGGVPIFTNSGTFQKTSGSGIADNAGMVFYNQPGALVQVDAGTLQLPVGSTNLFGTLRLNGGTLTANGTFPVAGGTLDGSGTFGANAFTGGNLSPGTNSAGQMNFSAGLNLNSNVTLTIDGNGPVPGVSYDSLSVTGAVVITNCMLQVTALPDVPAGTKFTLIANDGADAVIGNFSGLPENALLAVGTQNFRIHYAGGTGNDVTLVRDGVVVGPLLTPLGLTNGVWNFNASGAIPLIAYTVRASTNLVTWTNLAVTTSSVSGTFSFTDTNAWRYSRRFYNVTN